MNNKGKRSSPGNEPAGTSARSQRRARRHPEDEVELSPASFDSEEFFRPFLPAAEAREHRGKQKAVADRLTSLPFPVLLTMGQHLGARDLLKGLASCCVGLRHVALQDSLWKVLLERRWPVIYEEQRLSASVGVPRQILTIPYKMLIERGDKPPTRTAHQEPEEGGWACKFVQIWAGLCVFRLQVFHREVAEGDAFCMSAYEADVHYDHQSSKYMVRYLRKAKTGVAITELVEERRLRPIPTPTRGARNPWDLWEEGLARPSATHPTPAVGDRMEVQWKLEKGHQFGWWFSEVAAVGGDFIDFRNRQYAPGMQWRDATVRWKMMRIYPFVCKDRPYVHGSAGFVGGMRRLSPGEVERWEEMMPAAPLVL